LCPLADGLKPAKTGHRGSLPKSAGLTPLRVCRPLLNPAAGTALDTADHLNRHQAHDGLNQAELLVLAANCNPNATNIDLVGLQASGVEFV